MYKDETLQSLFSLIQQIQLSEIIVTYFVIFTLVVIFKELLGLESEAKINLNRRFIAGLLVSYFLINFVPANLLTKSDSIFEHTLIGSSFLVLVSIVSYVVLRSTYVIKAYFTIYVIFFCITNYIFSKREYDYRGLISTFKNDFVLAKNWPKNKMPSGNFGNIDGFFAHMVYHLQNILVAFVIINFSVGSDKSIIFISIFISLVYLFLEYRSEFFDRFNNSRRTAWVSGDGVRNGGGTKLHSFYIYK